MTTRTMPTVSAGVHSTKSIGTCARLIALAGLDEMLEGEGRYTLFAPIDSAFDELPPGALAALESDRAQLRAVLEYHILSVECELAEIRNGKLTTVGGTLLTSSVTDDGLRLDHANTHGYPVHCGNGVIYPIDAVLFPGFTPASAKLLKESPWSGRKQPPRMGVSPTAAQAAEAFFDPPRGSA